MHLKKSVFPIFTADEIILLGVQRPQSTCRSVIHASPSVIN